MKRSGGFAVIEMMIAALVIAILVLGSYYFVKRSHHMPTVNKTPAENFTAANATPPPAPTVSPKTSTLKIPEFGIQLVNIPDSIKDLTYAFYPANTDSNFTEANFTTGVLHTTAPNCSIGTLDRYPGKYSADKFQGQGNFVKQFKDFWILEVDEGVPCMVNKAAEDMQNNQVITFKQYVTKPDNLQILPK
ncbi:MAG TPA: prepilin-type N-terminal cleavage/methylation domain-containing protein [Candidatus Saccharimonadales bacterium]|nr:prepilin-type N-terminal cleavage/methylation domain-containing protein [Candidatus Saccharimonadales bacterium]